MQICDKDRHQCAESSWSFKSKRKKSNEKRILIASIILILGCLQTSLTTSFAVFTVFTTHTYKSVEIFPNVAFIVSIWTIVCLQFALFFADKPIWEQCCTNIKSVVN